MRNIYDNIIPNNPIVKEVGEIKRYRSAITIEKRKELSSREILEKIINTTYNKKQPDGRIYGLSKDGQYVSHSVTPYADSFLDNIEDGIKPLLLALKDKGYLSFSSCEGHSLWDRRFIMLVFPSKQLAQEFTEKIPFNLSYRLEHCTEFLNVNLDYDQYGNIINVKKKELTKNTEQSLQYINTFIKRNYADAWFLEMRISDPIEYTPGLFKYFKNIKQILFKMFFINSYTQRLTDFVIRNLEANIY